MACATWLATKRMTTMLRMLLILALLVQAAPVHASGTIGYGSRAGMEVSVVSISGLDTARAVIRTRHTRQNAITFCRDYVQKVTEECIQEELGKPLNDVITANCLTGNFTDFYGYSYRFLGRQRKPGDFAVAKYVIMDLGTREIADGSSASGYSTNMALFKALCPAHAPHDE